MEVRSIGSLNVTVIGLGCNNFGLRLPEEESKVVVSAALDAGITLFDTADVYGQGRSEEILGEALSGKREQIHIATKFGYQHKPEDVGRCSAKHIRAAVQESLRRLRTDYIDLYQMHRIDPVTPIEETLATLKELVESGLVREIGCSDADPRQLANFHAAGANSSSIQFASVQNEFSILHRKPEQGVLEACEKFGLSFLPYYPLADGLLTGKYKRNEPPPTGTRLSMLEGERLARAVSGDRFGVVDQLREVAKAQGHSLLELALAWLIAQSSLASVIAGASKPSQVLQNVEAASWRVGPEVLRAVDRIVPPGEVVPGRSVT
jgi:aryl-alcohol dehydrogenase-like predicted oxidoreductase